MSKHTPGPWRTEMNGFCRMAVIDKNFNYLTYKAGNDRMPDEELEANSRLIAAAPDLLKALEEVERLCRVSGYVGVNGQYLKVIRNLIAETKGE